jgi:antitoxin component YwqK of YwqJK toxin-antitoxin module
MQDKTKQPRNEKGQWHGYWELYHDNGKLARKGLYINHRAFGVHEKYWADGKLCHKSNYINGVLYGYCEDFWYNQDYLRCEIKLYYAR